MKQGMMDKASASEAWKTKPTDRFVLRWIKVNLSSRITPKLAHITWIRPWMITVGSTILGMAAGLVYALGWGLPAGVMAAASQVLDGVDGQLARLTGRQSPAGAFLDSVLDRYTDGALVIGTVIFLIGSGSDIPTWQVLLIGTLALLGSGLISYSTARADTLGLDMGKPTLASKGTRTTVTILGALFSPITPYIPFAALCYLALHANVAVLIRIWRAYYSLRNAPASKGSP
jgi:phosphatidylglycerophosphate synthase